MEIKIYYEDTDCGGVVYYANYFKYFERARTHYLEDHGLSVPALHQQGIVLVVTETNASFKSPARYGDILVIKTAISAPRKSVLTFSHIIHERQSQRIIVEGSASLVMTNGQGKIRRIPPDFFEALIISNLPASASS